MNKIETKILNCSAVREAEKKHGLCSKAYTAGTYDPFDG